MGSRRASRLIAALTAVFIAASGVGASLYPRTAAAKECCKKRCDHDAERGMQGCCCGVPASPAASASVSNVSPVGFTALPASVAPVVRLAGAPCVLRFHAPPGTPGFLARCTLLL